MIKLENVYKFYKIERYRKVVLNDVSINFEPGVNYAILGINGAGKSTLVRLLAGAELPNSGQSRARCGCPGRSDLPAACTSA